MGKGRDDLSVALSRTCLWEEHTDACTRLVWEDVVASLFKLPQESASVTSFVRLQRRGLYTCEGSQELLLPGLALITSPPLYGVGVTVICFILERLREPRTLA